MVPTKTGRPRFPFSFRPWVVVEVVVHATY
jgi:hypothetical protein